MSMNITVTVPPTFAAVHLAECKAALGIEDDWRDAALQGVLATAIEEIERRCDMALTRRTYRGFLDGWPVDSRGCVESRVLLPFAPAISVTHIKTYDADGAATTMSAGDYLFSPSRLSAGKRPSDGRVLRKPGATWPTPLQVADGIEIEWVAGFATAGEIPEGARHAAILLARHLFDEDPQKEEPPAIRALVANLRSWAF
jgi:uncharacterized phiE125 gp8 family phage protein